MQQNMDSHKKEEDKVDYEDLIYKEGIFAKNFPIQFNEDDDFGEISIKKKDFKDLVAISDEFEFHFFNSGLMHKGNIYTFKTSPVECDDVTTLGDIMEKGEVDEKYYLLDEKLEKWKYLKGSKKVPRKRPNGETYYFSEGKIAFPDKLDVPARTMLTSESTTNRSSHVVKDVQSGNLRTLTPIEAERIQMFPDDWTKIESDARCCKKNRRLFINNCR